MSRDVDGTGDINEWSDDEFRMFEDLELPDTAYDDPFVRLLFDSAMFTPNGDYEWHVLARQNLRDILEREYGFDFESEFDWADYQLHGESSA